MNPLSNPPAAITGEQLHAACHALGITDLDDVRTVTMDAHHVQVERYARDDGRIKVQGSAPVTTTTIIRVDWSGEDPA